MSEELVGFHTVKTEIARKILLGDEYHSYLICSSLAVLLGMLLFEGANEPATLSFHPRPNRFQRCAESPKVFFKWTMQEAPIGLKMCGTLTVDLSPKAYRDLQLVEASSDKFYEFFHGFKRCMPVLK